MKGLTLIIITCLSSLCQEVTSQYYLTLSVNDDYRFDFVHNSSVPNIIDYEKIRNHIETFCLNDWLPSNCKILLLSELFKKISIEMSVSSPWLLDSIIKVSFTEEIINIICYNKYWNFSYYNIEECEEIIEKEIRTQKVWLSSHDILPLGLHMDSNQLIQLSEGWDSKIEGNTFYFIDKVRTLSKYADDPRVSTICEIGFNAGHSTVNWLNSNPKASLVAFDVVRYLYTSAAVNAIYSLFPNRNFLLITGDSNQSVPRASHLLHSSCNILFIDGGHTYDIALADLIHMRPLANESFHRVIIDDGFIPDVRRAVLDSIDLQIFTPLTEVLTNQSLCRRGEKILEGKEKGKIEEFEAEDCPHPPESNFRQDSLIIGTYLPYTSS